MYKKFLIAIFFKLDRMIGKRTIENNVKSMGYSRAEARSIVYAYRKAIQMLKDTP